MIMARKKKKPAKKSAKKSAAKAGKSGSRKKAKSPKKKSAKSAGSKGTRKSAGSTSVDSLLRTFAKERTQKQSQLAMLQKKRRELEEKTRKFEEQIAKIAGQEKQASEDISSLDQRRDQQVAELLTKLGVKLGGNTTSVATQQAPGAGAKDGPQRHRDSANAATMGANGAGGRNQLNS